MRNNIISDYSRLYGQLNEETRQHSYSVACISESIANIIHLDPFLAFKIGYLHDVGKIYIPPRILKKNMQLNSVEREIVDLHSYFGYRLLVEAGESKDVYFPVLFHHGFNKPRLQEDPEPITMENLKYIHLVHSVDIFDAMARTRTYHEGFERQEIINALASDPMCSEEILDVIKQNDFVVQNIDASTDL